MRGAIDVGTNTVRFLAGNVRSGRVFPERYFRRITRLGGNFQGEGGLAPEAAARTLEALKEIAGVAIATGVHTIRGVGTAVLRCADNGPAFIERIRVETGLAIEVISGEEEARLSALGVLSALEERPPACLIVDIGGGSTEFVLWQGEPLLQRSLPLGVVRLAEDFSDPRAQAKHIQALLGGFQAECREKDLWPLATARECLLIGTAGTVTTLAALHLGMAEYDWRRVNNLPLHRGDLEKILQRLTPLTPAEREAVPGMERGRGDLILPGLRIVLSILELFGRPGLIVSDFGLLEGILLDLAGSGKQQT